MTPRKRQLSNALEQILGKLIDEYFPEKVILFGSMAEDRVSEWSDLDIVIVKETDKPFLERLREVVLLCNPTVGVDFFVYSPREFAAMIAEKNPFVVGEILEKGKVLYERGPGASMA